MPKITKILIVAFFSLLIVLSGEITNVKAADPVCQMTFGSACVFEGENGFCYGGRCKLTTDKEFGEAGDPCGTKGGICASSCGIGDYEDTNERKCESGLKCCVDEDNLHNDICVNVSNGTKIVDFITSVDIYCYDNKIDQNGSLSGPGNDGTFCGTELKAACFDTPNLGGCEDLDLDGDGVDDGLQESMGGGRGCETGSDCCYNLGDQVEGGGFGTGGNDFVFKQDEIPRETCTGTQPQEGIAGGFAFFKKAIIPCGRKCDDGNTSLNEMEDCTLCHFIILGKNVYDLLLALLILAAILLVTIGGVLYMLSGANPSLNGLAKTIITKTLFGFILFLASWMIVFTILKMLSYNTAFLGSGGEWWSITCETEGALDIHED